MWAALRRASPGFGFPGASVECSSCDDIVVLSNVKISEGRGNGLVAHECADGGEGDSFGVKSGCIAVAEAMGGSERCAGAVAEIEHSALQGAGVDGEQLRRSGAGLVIDRCCDGLLEARGQWDRAPSLGLGGPDAETVRDKVAGVEGEGFSESAASVGHETDGELQRG